VAEPELQEAGPAACPCRELEQLRAAVAILRKRRPKPTLKDYQQAVKTIDHLLEENRGLRERLWEKRT